MDKKVLDKLLRFIKKGTLKVTFWDGEVRVYGQGLPRAAVVINSRKLPSRLLLKNPSIALGEAYASGEMVVVEPLQNLLKLAEINMGDIEKLGQTGRKQKLHKNKKSAQQGFIAQHYDIGNDFYKLWLDSTMSYSCAYFHKPGDSLDQAQRQKIEHILKKLQLKSGHKLLDIGSGWGHLLVTAAKKYKIKGLGVSLSREQVVFARQLAKKEGVSELVQFKLLNYQDIAGHEIFDRIVSVGFYEHVGYGNHRDYFAVVNRLLKPGGISLLHSITHQTETPTDPWLDKYIFPGGYIPSVRETTMLLPDYDMFLFDYENLGQHYGLTLEQWWKRFENQKKTITNMFDERFYRMWRLYLIASMMAFRSGYNHLSQWTFKKGSDPTWPLTRDHLYKRSIL